MMRRPMHQSPAAPALVACEPARVMPACGIVPSAHEGRLYEPVRAVRIDVFERAHGGGARSDWLVSATPIGDNDVEWPEYVERASGDDLEALISAVLPDGVFAAGVFVPVEELDEWLDLGAA